MYLYSGTDLFISPEDWEGFLGYFPDWLYDLMQLENYGLVFLRILGIGECLFAIFFLGWFFPKKLVQLAAMLASFEMLVILCLVGINSVTFRDIGLVGALLALFFLIRQPHEA